MLAIQYWPSLTDILEDIIVSWQKLGFCLRLMLPELYSPYEEPMVSEPNAGFFRYSENITCSEKGFRRNAYSNDAIMQSSTEPTADLVQDWERCRMLKRTNWRNHWHNTEFAGFFLLLCMVSCCAITAVASCGFWLLLITISVAAGDVISWHTASQ